MRDVLEGAVVGAVAGLVSGLVGELGVFAVSQLAPSDVLVTGFALLWAVPLGIVAGAFAGWRGLWPDRMQRAAIAAAPGYVAGATAMLIQWSSA